MPLTDTLKQTLSTLPTEPGVYLMKNNAGTIIYIGKASSLKKRVSSYFQKKDHDPKTAILVKKISDIEYIVTDSEMEALILESTLIKKHKPRFNIRLKDDKRYPYIAVTLGENFPRVIYTRSVRNTSNRYFGPFTDARAARSMVNTTNSIFKLKTCKRELPLKKGERPCLNYQMKKCNGACTGKISREEYRGLVHNAIDFLEGNISPALEDLKKKMEAYSESMEFEKAAALRDIIFDIQKTTETQNVAVSFALNHDYLDVGIQGDEALLVVFEFRKGVLGGRKINVFENTDLAEKKDIVRSFIINHYTGGDIPDRIVTDYSIADRELLESYLSEKEARKIKIMHPGSAEDRSILNLIGKNIESLLADREAAQFYRDREAGLVELQEVLKLSRIPETMVCFDISNFQGTDAVASMVSFRHGAPDKGNYRRFKIRGYEGANDSGMIHEAVARRLQHMANEDQPLPDLMVIDGGPTQLTRAKEAAANFTDSLAIISLAKRFEEIYFDPKVPPLRLKETSPALKILQAIRDESHRFAITYHRKIRDTKLTGSLLDDIPGIGYETRRLLLEKFKSLEALGNASLEELQSVEGIGEKTAMKIREFLHGR